MFFYSVQCLTPIVFKSTTDSDCKSVTFISGNYIHTCLANGQSKSKELDVRSHDVMSKVSHVTQMQVYQSELLIIFETMLN